LRDGRRDDPLSDRDHQPVGLDDAEEVSRTEDAALWVLPPEKRLDSDDLLRDDVEHGLVVELQLVEADGILELPGERHPLLDRRPHLRPVDLVAMLAERLRAQHRLIGGTQ
jgi:hypothetical protein